MAKNAIVMGGVAAACLMAGVAQARDLTVVTFGGALQEAMKRSFFKPYTEDRKIKVAEDTYTGGVAKLKAMVQSGTTLWDVAQMDDNEMAVACEEGLLERIDPARLPEGKNLLPGAHLPCGIGAFVWSEVLAYDGKRTQGVESWADMWNVEKWPGKRGLRKVARGTLEIALLADGVTPEKVYEVLGTKEGQDRAFRKLDVLKPNIRWWDSGAQATEWLASGEVVMTETYNGRMVAANKEGKDFRIVWKNQLYSMDFWTIPKGGDVKQGLDMIGYMTSAGPQKAFAEDITYGVVNTAASHALSPSVQKLLPTSDNNMIGALQLSIAFWVDREEELQQRFNRWLAQ